MFPSSLTSAMHLNNSSIRPNLWSKDLRTPTIDSTTEAMRPSTAKCCSSIRFAQTGVPWAGPHHPPTNRNLDIEPSLCIRLDIQTFCDDIRQISLSTV